MLRPQLSGRERAAFLVEVFSYLGDGYDFRFDFVLFVEKNPDGKTNEALVLVGSEGEPRLKALMDSL